MNRCHPFLRSLARQNLPAPAMRREIRERAGVSQSALGCEVGVTGACVSLWEREEGGREPRGVRLVRYVSLLKQLKPPGMSDDVT